MIQSELIDIFNDRYKSTNLYSDSIVSSIHELLNIFSLECGDMSMPFKDKADGMVREITSIIKEYSNKSDLVVKIEEPQSKLVFDYGTINDILSSKETCHQGSGDMVGTFEDVYPIVMSNNVLSVGRIVNDTQTSRCCCNLNGTMDIILISLEYEFKYYDEPYVSAFDRTLSKKFKVDLKEQIIRHNRKVLKNISFKFIYKK